MLSAPKNTSEETHSEHPSRNSGKTQRIRSQRIRAKEKPLNENGRTQKTHRIKSHSTRERSQNTQTRNRIIKNPLRSRRREGSRKKEIKIQNRAAVLMRSIKR